MGLSIRAYAKQRGVSDAAVRKAISTGRISKEADGTINPSMADAEWEKNTDAAQQRGHAKPTPVAGRNLDLGSASLGGGSPTFTQARTVNEVVKAQTNKVRLAKLKNELIDRNQAIAHVFKLARSERDAWLNWPSRVSATMAATLGVDPHTTHAVLDSAVREQLLALGELRLRVD
jgi:hypothetical protein